MINVTKPSLLYVTCYFAGVKSRQRRHRRKASRDNINYIKPWYNSLLRLDQEGLILYSGLSDEFIETYSTSKIRFMKVTLDEKFSINDYRFVLYQTLYSQITKNYDFVFFTDARDLTIVQSPDKYPTDKLFVGSEKNNLKRQIKRWIAWHHLEKDPTIFESFDYQSYKVFNAGILGGSTSLVKLFLDDFNTLLTYLYSGFSEEDILQQDKKTNINMVVFNLTCLKWINYIETGTPIHSIFAAHENERKDVWFIHK